MITLTKTVRAAAGIVVLVVIIVLVMSYLGAYKSARSGDAPDSGAETTKTAEATQTPSGEQAKGSGGDSSTTPSIGTVTVVVDGLNFRVAASRDSELIRGLDAGEKLSLLAEESGWLKVKDSAGKIGYVSSSSQYTKVEK